MSACFRPGWDKGPNRTGERPSTFMCERSGRHRGDHGWNEDVLGKMQTTWPVTKKETK